MGYLEEVELKREAARLRRQAAVMDDVLKELQAIHRLLKEHLPDKPSKSDA